MLACVTTQSCVQLCVLAVSALLVALLWFYTSHSQPVPPALQWISWSILLLSLLTPLLAPTRPYPRLLGVGLGLLPPYLLLSTAHEGLFLLALCVQLYTWIQLEARISYR